MVVFLYGQDSYRLKQNLNKIVEEYKKKNTEGISFSIIDLSDGDINKFSELENIVKTNTFFDEKRLVVLKNPFLIATELIDLIKKWKLTEDKGRIVVCVEEQTEAELKKDNKTLFSLLSGEPNVVKNFEPLEDKQLENWVVKEIAKYDRKIETQALRKLILYAGGDSWLIGQEINKLINYKTKSANETITLADVDTLTIAKIDLNIFEIVDAVAHRNTLRATKLLHNHLDSNADPHYLFSMIVYQFRNLLRVKDLVKNAVPIPDIIRKTKLNPYVVKKTYEQSRGFELDELKNMFSRLADLDVAVKNGEIDMVDGLYQFIFSLKYT